MTAPTPDRPDLSRDQFTNDESYYLATGRTPAFTPEQMRALANDLHTINRRARSLTVSNSAAALRAAADQLEAVHALSADLDKEHGQHEVFAFLVASDIRDILGGHPERVTWTEKPAFLTAETAPQEDRDAD